MSRKGCKRVTYYEIGFPIRKVVRYERRSQRRKEIISLLPLGIIIFSTIVGRTTDAISLVVNDVFAKETELLSPYVEPYTTVYEDYPVREVQSEDSQVDTFSSPSQQDNSHEVGSEIEKLITQEFGEDAEIAIAIARAESGLNPNREGIHIAGKHTWSSATYKGECSIGLFQINLASNACNGKWVHASKIPGETIEEKIAWLKIPENNIKTAKEIYKASGFNPWSTFTQGTYKKYL